MKRYFSSVLDVSTKHRNERLQNSEGSSECTKDIKLQHLFIRFLSFDIFCYFMYFHWSTWKSEIKS